MSLPLQPPSDAQETQLMRDVLGTAAHDIGGLASALALRAETIASADGQALAAIANELRQLGRQLRQLRGPGGGELLAPTASGNIPSILALVERFGRGALGRGVSLIVQSVDQVVPPAEGDALTYGLLAVLRALREADLELPAVVHIVAAAHEPDAVRITVRIAGADGSARPWPARQLQWLAVAERVFHRARLHVTHALDELELVAPRVAP
jgi:hypothetical protein